MCSVDKNAYVDLFMVSQLDGAAQNVRVCRGFHDWELESVRYFLDLVYKSPQEGGSQ